MEIGDVIVLSDGRHADVVSVDLYSRIALVVTGEWFLIVEIV